MVTPFYSFESVEDVGDDDGKPENKNTFQEKDIIMTILKKKALAAVMKHLPRCSFSYILIFLGIFLFLVFTFFS